MTGVRRTQAEWDAEVDRVLGNLRAHDAQKAARGSERPSAPAGQADGYTNPWGRKIGPGGVAETREAGESHRVEVQEASNHDSRPLRGKP